jgi:hypothetical protein
MISRPDLHPPQPPRIAMWFLALFTPAEVEVSITGDLLEEFSGIAIESGYAFARRWYWRQILKTIIDTSASAFRAAPWLMLVTVIGGFWLIGFATRSSQHAMRMFLDSRRIYELHPNAYLFWLKFPLEIGHIVICSGIGALVGLAARRIEMAAAMALALLQIALFLAGTVALIAGGREWLNWFLFMLPWNSVSFIATIIGGAIVRICRSRVAVRPSAA